MLAVSVCWRLFEGNHRSKTRRSFTWELRYDFGRVLIAGMWRGNVIRSGNIAGRGTYEEGDL